MLNPISHTPHATGASPLVPTSSSTGGANTNLSSIEQAFATAFSSVLQQLGIGPNNFQISTGGAGSNGQLLVSFTLPGNNSSAASTATTAPSAATAASTTPVKATPALSTSASTPASTATGIPTTWYTPNAADDAYWNAQPAAVQQLRQITSEPQRQALATQLASQGYQIDMPIMVWGWDAAKTTALRQQYGYTWVPAMGQAPIQVAPGLNFPGFASYNPNNPPPGSILVPPAGSSLA